MKTIKPTSTISYNSFGFLKGTLERLTKNGIIKFWAFIEHLPEEDENKAHYHVYIEPADRLDTNWLKTQFLETDPNNPEKPLGCMPFDPSKFTDWYWYGLHDVAYLASKGQSRKMHYSSESVISSDGEYLAEKVRLNPCPASDIYKVMELAKKGYKPVEIAVAMNVSMSRLAFFMAGLEMLSKSVKELNETYRAGRLNHEPTPFLLVGQKPKVDEDTGEVLDD